MKFILATGQRSTAYHFFQSKGWKIRFWYSLVNVSQQSCAYANVQKPLSKKKSKILYKLHLPNTKICYDQIICIMILHKNNHIELKEGTLILHMVVSQTQFFACQETHAFFIFQPPKQVELQVPFILLNNLFDCCK